MILCLSQGRNDPEDLERVLPVLDRRLDDGGDGGVVLRAGFGSEASADLHFGLGRTERLLAVVVGGRDLRVCQEGEDMVPVFGDTLLEFVQFGVLAVAVRVNGRPGKQFVEPLLFLGTDLGPDVPLVPLVDGVPQEVQHVQAPGIVRESLHRVSEVSQQVQSQLFLPLPLTPDSSAPATFPAATFCLIIS